MATNIRRALAQLRGTGNGLLAGAVAMLMIALLGALAALWSSGEVGCVTMVTAAAIGGALVTRWAVLRVIGRQPMDEDRD